MGEGRGIPLPDSLNFVMSVYVFLNSDTHFVTLKRQD